MAALAHALYGVRRIARLWGGHPRVAWRRSPAAAYPDRDFLVTAAFLGCTSPRMLELTLASSGSALATVILPASRSISSKSSGEFTQTWTLAGCPDRSACCVSLGDRGVVLSRAL